MLEKLRLHNFMSHKETVVKFHGSKILITGDNGSGKSSLLEAIPYVLFGITRSSSEDVIRKGETSMLVSLKMYGYTIIRGRKTGSNFLRVLDNDGKEYKGKLAQEKINKLIEVNKQGFLLTTFFGFGENDSLLNVTSSVRMKTLENITGIQIYEKFYKETRERMQEVTLKRDATKKELSVLGDPTGELNRLKEELEVKKEEIKEERQALRFIEADVSLSEKQFQACTDIKKHYTAKFSDAERIGLYEGKVDFYQAEINVIDQELEVINQRRRALLKLIPSTYEDTLGKIKSLEDSMDRIRGELHSLQKIVDTFAEDRKECPMCFQEVSYDMYKGWEEQYHVLSGWMTSWQKSYKEAKERQQYKEEHVALHDKIIELEDRKKEAKDNLYDMETALAVYKQDHNAVDLDKIQTDINESKKIWEGHKLRLFNQLRHIDSETRIQAQLESEIEEVQDNIVEYDSLMYNYDMFDREVLAYTHLLRAYSPTGIPLELIHEFSIMLSQRATYIYNRFAEGQIIVENVQEGKSQGVEIKIVQHGHTKKYKELSEGQKIMVFLAVRLALTGILYKGIPPFIVLDEVSGHLSEKSMDNLLKTITEFIGEWYGQVILVSHTNVRDIFDSNLHCELEDGVSSVKER